MVSQKVMVTNPTGLHLGPAGKFCNEAMRFDSRVIFTYGKDANGEANAKSILSILGAAYTVVTRSLSYARALMSRRHLTDSFHL